MAFGKPREEGRIGGQSVERGLAGGGGCGLRPSLSPVPRSFTRRTESGQRPLRGGEQTLLHPCHSRENGNTENASADHTLDSRFRGHDRDGRYTTKSP